MVILKDVTWCVFVVLICILLIIRASQVVQVVKNPPARAGDLNRHIYKEDNRHMKRCSISLIIMHASIISDFLWPYWLWRARLLYAWDSPGKNTGVGCHALLQGNLPDAGIESVSLMSPALAGGFFTTCTTWEALMISKIQIKTTKTHHVTSFRMTIIKKSEMIEACMIISDIEHLFMCLLSSL